MLWDTLKAVMRGKVIAKTTWLRKNSVKNILTLKELEQGFIKTNTTQR